MSIVDENFGELIAQVRKGSEDAAWRLIEHYGPHIQRVVRRTLDRRLRGKFDSVDFVQAVWASFFREPAQIREFQTPEQIVGYLATSARYKVVDEMRRRLGTKKHDVTRELPLDDSTLGSDPLISDGPTPEEIAIAREVWNDLISGQTTRHQEIVRLRFAGATFPEIAKELDIHERTARKVMDRLLRLKSA
jgi:RNA polymerase sigma-70 factor (ECF subfamily)